MAAPIDPVAIEYAQNEAARQQRAEDFKQSVMQMRSHDLTPVMGSNASFAGNIASYRRYLQLIETVIVSPIQLANSQLDFLFGTASNLISSARDVTRSLQSIVALSANQAINIVYELLRFRTIGLCQSAIFARNIGLEYINLARAAVLNVKDIKQSGKVFNQIRTRWNDRWTGVRANLARTQRELADSTKTFIPGTGYSPSRNVSRAGYEAAQAGIVAGHDEMSDAIDIIRDIDQLENRFSVFNEQAGIAEKGVNQFVDAVDKFKANAFYDRLAADSTQEFTGAVDTILRGLENCHVRCGRDPHAIYREVKTISELVNAIKMASGALNRSSVDKDELNYEEAAEGNAKLYRQTRNDVLLVERTPFSDVSDLHQRLVSNLKSVVAIGKSDGDLDSILADLDRIGNAWIDAMDKVCQRLQPFKNANFSKVTKTIAALFDFGNARIDVLDALLDGAWDVVMGARSLFNISLQGRFITLLQDCLKVDLVFAGGGTVAFASSFQSIQSYLDRVYSQIGEATERIRQAISNAFQIVNDGFALVNALISAILSIVRICNDSTSPTDALSSAQRNFDRSLERGLTGGDTGAI